MREYHPRIDPTTVLKYMQKKRLSCQGDPGAIQCLDFLKSDGWYELYADLKRAKTAERKIYLCQKYCPVFASCILAVRQILNDNALELIEQNGQHRT